MPDPRSTGTPRFLRRLVIAACGAALLAAFAPGGVGAVGVTQPVGSQVAVGDFVRPATANATSPVIVFLHDAMSHHDAKPIARMRAALAERGFTVLTPTLTLSIDRRNAPFDCRLVHTHRLGDGVSELDLWVAALRQAGYRNIWVGGIGLGANVAARFLRNSAKDATVTGGVLVDPYAEPNGQQGVQDAYALRFGLPLAPILTQAERLVAAGRGSKGFDAPGLLECKDARTSAESFLSYLGPDPDRDTPALVARIAKPVLVLENADDPDGEAVLQRVGDIRARTELKVQMLPPGDREYHGKAADDAADAIALFAARFPR
ncbi:MAG: hypothetical protein JNM13_15955 [Hyphomicrobiaceae bacterium]|nr:hypothetical protein [Hyphomicrobiaceae bacterium]